MTSLVWARLGTHGVRMTSALIDLRRRGSVGAL